MTGARKAIAGLIAALPRCEGHSGRGCRAAATHTFPDGRRACAECARDQEYEDEEDGPIVATRNDRLADAIEAAERALTRETP